MGILWIEKSLFLDLEANGSEAEMMVPMLETGRLDKMMMVMNDSRKSTLTNN